MSTEQDYKVERPDWCPPGPWMTEPDKVVWKTAAGLPGMIVRSRSGNLCGYVAVAEGHPLFGVGYSDGDSVDALDCQIRVHGGLTYSNKCAGNICHVPEPGEPDDVWWFGFDCAHSQDWRWTDAAPYLKGLRDLEPTWERSYRDIAYVTSEVESLAAQLAARSGHVQSDPGGRDGA